MKDSVVMIFIVWFAKPRAKCLESGENAKSLGNSLLLIFVICNTFSVCRSISLNNPFSEKVTIRLPVGLTAKLMISSLLFDKKESTCLSLGRLVLAVMS